MKEIAILQNKCEFMEDLKFDFKIYSELVVSQKKEKKANVSFPNFKLIIDKNIEKKMI